MDTQLMPTEEELHNLGFPTHAQGRKGPARMAWHWGGDPHSNGGHAIATTGAPLRCRKDCPRCITGTLERHTDWLYNCIDCGAWIKRKPNSQKYASIIQYFKEIHHDNKKQETRHVWRLQPVRNQAPGH
jgi:hypothetical protein